MKIFCQRVRGLAKRLKSDDSPQRPFSQVCFCTDVICPTDKIFATLAEISNIIFRIYIELKNESHFIVLKIHCCLDKRNPIRFSIQYKILQKKTTISNSVHGNLTLGEGGGDL
jgi:hypothetical protein